MVLATKVRRAPSTCGFCSTEHHNLCPRAVRNGDGSIVRCNCDQPYCGSQVLRCLVCKNEADGEVGEDWRCIDREACADTQQKRLDTNPHLRMVREVMVRVSETQVEEKVAKAEKAPKKPTTCIHCGAQTKGGLFLPGHDARFVAELVKQVLDDTNKTTEESALADLKDRGASEALQGKFTKSVSLARTEAEKREAAQKAADERAREKAEQEAARAAKIKEKVEEAPVPDTQPEPEATVTATEPDGAANPAPAKKANKKS